MSSISVLVKPSTHRILFVSGEHDYYGQYCIPVCHSEEEDARRARY